MPLTYDKDESNVESTLKKFINKYSSFTPGVYMPLILQRPPGTSFEYRYTFPPELDLSEYSTNDNKKFSLEMIIAYAGFHYSVFQNEETWYYINDNKCWEIQESLIADLYGGTTLDKNLLWIHCIPYQWTVRMLFYKAKKE